MIFVTIKQIAMIKTSRMGLSPHNLSGSQKPLVSQELASKNKQNTVASVIQNTDGNIKEVANTA